jgi:hypothetical protein
MRTFAHCVFRVKNPVSVAGTCVTDAVTVLNVMCSPMAAIPARRAPRVGVAGRVDARADRTVYEIETRLAELEQEDPIWMRRRDAHD